MIDLDTIEASMKLMAKYKIKELILSDGTKLVKEIHEVKPATTRRKKLSIVPFIDSAQPDNIPDAVKYAASGPPKNGYSQYKISSILPDRK